MSDERTKLFAAAAADERYPIEAYEFLCHALAYTQKALDRMPRPGESPEEALDKHVTGQELCDGIREFAIDQFGPMAYVVFSCWGIRRTDDFGNMVYHLIDSGVWYRSPSDRREDFHDRYDFERVFRNEVPIELDDGQ